MATGLEKVSFHFNPKERQYQRVLKLPHNCTQFTNQQSNSQNSPSQNSTVQDMRTSRCSSCIQKRQRNQRSNCQHSLDHRESKGIPEKNISICFTDYAKAFHIKDHNKLWKILKEMGVPDHFTFILTSVHVGKKAAVRIRHKTTERFTIGTGARQGIHCHSGYLNFM